MHITKVYAERPSSPNRHLFEQVYNLNEKEIDTVTKIMKRLKRKAQDILQHKQEMLNDGQPNKKVKRKAASEYDSILPSGLTDLAMDRLTSMAVENFEKYAQGVDALNTKFQQDGQKDWVKTKENSQSFREFLKLIHESAKIGRRMNRILKSY